jgi:hypothetical protein
MKAQKNRDPFSIDPRLNVRGRPIVALMIDNQPRVVKACADHGPLTIDDLHVLIGGNKRALYETVDVLKRKPNEYIRVVPEDVRNHVRIRKLRLEVAQNGVSWLQDNGHQAQLKGRVYNLSHATLVSHIMASISAGIAQQPTAHFISWEEMQTHPKFPADTRSAADNTAVPSAKGHIRPDTHPFGIVLDNGAQKAYRFYVIEADNGTETIRPTRPATYTGNSIYAKFEAYLDFIESKGFRDRYGLPNYFVLFVFTSRARLDTAKTLLASMNRPGARNILFQLAQQETGPAGYVFTSPCERVGYHSLQLSQP